MPAGPIFRQEWRFVRLLYRAEVSLYRLTTEAEELFYLRKGAGKLKPMRNTPGMETDYRYLLDEMLGDCGGASPEMDAKLKLIIAELEQYQLCRYQETGEKLFRRKQWRPWVSVGWMPDVRSTQLQGFVVTALTDLRSPDENRFAGAQLGFRYYQWHQFQERVASVDYWEDLQRLQLMLRMQISFTYRRKLEPYVAFGIYPTLTWRQVEYLEPVDLPNTYGPEWEWMPELAVGLRYKLSDRFRLQLEGGLPTPYLLNLGMSF